MKDLRYKGYTYTIYVRNWYKGLKKYEVIKYKTGFRNFWERTTVTEYNKIAELLQQKILS